MTNRINQSKKNLNVEISRENWEFLWEQKRKHKLPMKDIVNMQLRFCRLSFALTERENGTKQKLRVVK